MLEPMSAASGFAMKVAVSPCLRANWRRAGLNRKALSADAKRSPCPQLNSYWETPASTDQQSMPNPIACSPSRIGSRRSSSISNRSTSYGLASPCNTCGDANPLSRTSSSEWR